MGEEAVGKWHADDLVTRFNGKARGKLKWVTDLGCRAQRRSAAAEAAAGGARWWWKRPTGARPWVA